MDEIRELIADETSERENNIMLKCETNSTLIKDEIYAASKKFLEKTYSKWDICFNIFFDEQWYLIHPSIDDDDVDLYYSICDAEGIGTFNGFYFELLP